MHDLNKQLLSAASANNFQEVERLIAQGADINYTDPYGNFAMFSAAWEGNIEALDLFHRLGAALSFEDANLLCNAAYNGQVRSVQWLLDKGADANFAFRNTGENALHYTISKTSEMDQRVEIVRILLAAGTDVHTQTKPGQSTLCFMRDAFLKGETPLHRAAAYGNTAIISLLLAAGADPSVKDANGDTPLSWGSWHLRDPEVLRLLMYEGVARIN